MASSGQVLQYPYDFNKARIIVQEMTELLVLELVEKGEVTDSLTLTLGYDRSSIDAGKYKGVVAYDRYGRVVPKSAHGTANLGTTSSSTKKIITEFGRGLVMSGKAFMHRDIDVKLSGDYDSTMVRLTAESSCLKENII